MDTMNTTNTTSTTNMTETQQEMVLNYSDNFRHLADELKRLDLFIRHRVSVIRTQEVQRRAISLDPNLFISEEEVDALLLQQGESTGSSTGLAEVEAQIAALNMEINTRVSGSLKTGTFLAIPRLAQIFGFNAFECMVIIICLAPELRQKYEKLYVYLQNDIMRKKPSIDMVLDLLCIDEADKWQSRGYFSSFAPLFRNGILQVSEDGSCSLKIAQRFLAFLMGQNLIDEELLNSGAAKPYAPDLPIEDVLVSQETKDRIAGIFRGHFSIPANQRKKLVLHFHGPAGVGKRELATGLCSIIKSFMLYVDIEQWLGAGSDIRHLLRLAMREGLLQRLVVYLDGIDLMQADDTSSRSMLKSLASIIEEYGWLVILAGENPWSAAPGLFGDAIFLSFCLEVPDVELSRKAWEQSLDRIVTPKDPGLAEQMAEQYRLTPGQIKGAVESALYNDILGTINETGLSTPLGMVHLVAAGRRQSNRKLNQLAAKIDCRHGWDDIVLPASKLQQLKEICAQVKNRHQVFDEWGFGQKVSRGGGLSVIFTGSPGTGKTMAAEVMSKELELELYKIDLSGVISKYIGETEKNLSKIFHEAETSNAILFFDEADALFGKRSEVNDAHDRYANIETSYLLQKMEEYEGIVILATNFRKNMDDAFTRRIRYIVEFPFPDEESRERIWRSHFPELAPRSEAIDFKFLARKFPLSGGYIKNIVLDAAFLAAGNGRVIDMEHVLRGVRTEYEKIGKLWDGDSTPI